MDVEEAGQLLPIEPSPSTCALKLTRLTETSSILDKF